jgi:Protein of unknown function (DUF3592)
MAFLYITWLSIILILLLTSRAMGGNQAYYTRSVTGRIIYTNCLYVSTVEEDTHCTIEVQYDVNQTTYTKNFSVHTSDQYTNGQSITVYYNPGNPQRSVLRKDSSGMSLIYLAILTFIVGLVYFYYPMTKKEDVYSNKLPVAEGIEGLESSGLMS